MAKRISRPNRLLAESLERAKQSSQRDIIKSSDISRSDRERLLAAGWIREIIKGWYALLLPENSIGGSTSWFMEFWPFVSYYLNDRFGDNYCLSAESSLDLHVGENIIPPQVVALTTEPTNQAIKLPHHTSLLIYSAKNKFPNRIEKFEDLNVMALPLAIARLTPRYYQEKSLSVEIAIKAIGDISLLSRVLIEDEMVSAAGRIIGTLKFIGDSKKAEDIEQGMRSAGFTPKPKNPFQRQSPWLMGVRDLSTPYSGRIRALWETMRPVVIENFTLKPKKIRSSEKCVAVIRDLYEQDAYHSLSIEGYQVTEELINRIASGEWEPTNLEQDQKQTNALAAKGYHEAFQKVLESVIRVLSGEKASAVLEKDIQIWYRSLFTPLAQASLINPGDLAGYRANAVYIRGSKHVPPKKEVVPGAMETFFELMRKEPDARIRAVLGHFFFVFIHPYSDGNGRIARFLMNLMLLSGGYRWTVIRVSQRKRYMRSLEEASVNRNIKPFAKFIESETRHWTETKR